MSQIIIPEYLNKNLMCSKYVRIGPKEFVLVITRGPMIYVTEKGQMLSVCCDLTTTICKNLEWIESDFSQEPPKLFDFDICFSYVGRVRHVFFLLKMRDKFIVMLYSDGGQVTVDKQYENVRLFKVEEKSSSVHIRIEMLDGSSVCEDLYRLTTNDPIVDNERFGGVANKISNRVATVKAELSTTKLDVQKYFHVLAKELRFGPQRLHNSIEERVMLAKFGDTWMKRHNDMLVIGIPVYNCCYLSFEFDI